MARSFHATAKPTRSPPPDSSASNASQLQAWLDAKFPGHDQRGRPSRGDRTLSAAAALLGMTVRSLQRKRTGQIPVSASDLEKMEALREFEVEQRRPGEVVTRLTVMAYNEVMARARAEQHLAGSRQPAVLDQTDPEFVEKPGAAVKWSVRASPNGADR